MEANEISAELKSWGDRWGNWVGPKGDEARYKRMAECAYAGSEAVTEQDQLRAEVDRLKAALEFETAENDCECGGVRAALRSATARAEAAEKERDIAREAAVELAKKVGIEAVLAAETARAEAAEGRADGLYRALCDAVRASGGVAKEGISDTFLILGVPAEMAARKKAQEAAEAHVADLRGALEEVDKLAVAHSPQMSGKVSLRMMHPGMSDALHGVKVALARTPAQSLARVKAEALRATAKELESLRDHIQDYIAPDDARDDIRRICLNRAKDLRSEADLLQKEAANDPR